MRNFGSPRSFSGSSRLPSREAGLFYSVLARHRAFAELLADLVQLRFERQAKPFGNALRPVVVFVSGCGVEVFHEPDATASLGAIIPAVGVNS